MEGHLPPSSLRTSLGPAGKVRGEQLLQAALHGCVWVCLHVSLSGYVWMGPPRAGLPGPGLTLGEGPGRRAQAGCQALLRCKAQAELLQAGQANHLKSGDLATDLWGPQLVSPAPTAQAPQRFLRAPVTGLGRREGRATPALPPSPQGGQDPGSRLPRGFPQVPRLGKAPAGARRPLPPLPQQRAPEGKALPIQTCF